MHAIRDHTLITPRRIIVTQPTQHHADGRHLHPRLTTPHPLLIPPHTPAVRHQPPVRPLHHPPLPDRHEPPLPRGPTHHLQPHTPMPRKPRLTHAVMISAVREHHPHARPVRQRPPVQHRRGRPTVRHVRRRDRHAQQQPQRVRQGVPLPPLDLLAPVRPHRVAHPGRPRHRLAVDRRRRRLLLPPRLPP